MRSSRLIVALLSLAAASQTTSAQEPVATRPTAPPVPVLDSTAPILTQQGERLPPGCWRARRTCPEYFLTDIGVEFPLSSTAYSDPFAAGRRPDFRTRFIWTLGLMHTRDYNSHGIAGSLVADGKTGFIGEYRYRRWRDDSQGIDFGLGYKSNDVHDTRVFDARARGMTTMVGFTPNRWIGVSARVDFLRADGRSHRAVLVGLQSTRLSEEAFKLVFVTALQALLEKIGIETSDEDQ